MSDHTSPPAESSRFDKVLVLFLGATNAYDVFFASGVDLYLKLGIVASAVGFVLRRFVLDVGA